MSREFRRSILTIFLLIPVVLLIPNTGLGGESPPSGSLPVLPAYMGDLTVEWQSTHTTCLSSFWGGNSPCGNVIVYGRLKSAESGFKDIIVTKNNPVTLTHQGTPVAVAQIDFLSLEPADLTPRLGALPFGLPLLGPGTICAATSVNNLSYQSETLFTANVVVMQFE